MVKKKTKEDLQELLQNELDEKVLENNDCLSIIKINKKHYQVFIQEEIDDLKNYIKLFYLLKVLGSNDIIEISINSWGGSLHTGMQIYNAIEKSKAQVTTIIEHMAYSCGSIIFLAGHKKKVMPHSGMLIHNFSSEVEGKGHEIQLEVEFLKRSYERGLRDIYKFFLAEEEMQQMLDGKDLWFTDKEVKKRLRYPVT